MNPNALSAGTATPFLNGSASAERVAAGFHATEGETEDDFPAAALGRDGTVWVAYVSYRYGQPRIPYTERLQQQPDNFDFLVPKGNGDEVRLAKIGHSGDETNWSDVAELTPPGQDVYRPAVAVDGAGAVWVVWSQNVGDNWDLYCRRFSGGVRGGNINDIGSVLAGHRVDRFKLRQM